MSLTNAYVSDHREAQADVTGEDWLYTPAGARPIEPIRIKVSYHLRTGGVYVEIAGRKRFPYNTNGRRASDVTRRTFSGDDLAHLPAWAYRFVEEHLPKRTPEREGGWRV